MAELLRLSKENRESLSAKDRKALDSARSAIEMKIKVQKDASNRGKTKIAKNLQSQIDRAVSRFNKNITKYRKTATTVSPASVRRPKSPGISTRARERVAAQRDIDEDVAGRDRPVPVIKSPAGPSRRRPTQAERETERKKREAARREQTMEIGADPSGLESGRGDVIESKKKKAKPKVGTPAFAYQERVKVPGGGQKGKTITWGRFPKEDAAERKAKPPAKPPVGSTPPATSKPPAKPPVTKKTKKRQLDISGPGSWPEDKKTKKTKKRQLDISGPGSWQKAKKTKKTKKAKELSGIEQFWEDVKKLPKYLGTDLLPEQVSGTPGMGPGKRGYKWEAPFFGEVEFELDSSDLPMKGGGRLKKGAKKTKTRKPKVRRRAALRGHRAERRGG